MSQPEARILSRILKYLKSEGGRWVKIHGGDNPFQEVGIPDILGCYLGQAVAIEVKTVSGELSPRQQKFLREWGDAGGYVTVATSVPDVTALLKRIRNEH